MRKSFYNRTSQEDITISNTMMHHWVRGEGMEHILTTLSGIGVAQVPIELDGIVGTPDITRRNSDSNPDSFLIVELKSTASLRRFVPTDSEFKAYMLQLTAYMIMSEVEYGLLAIRYENRPMNWVSRDLDGRDHFERLQDASPPGIESWSVFMSLNSPERKQLREELLERKTVFAEALETNDVSLLARLRGRDKLVKCKSCDYNNTCWNVDVEGKQAAQMADKADLLDQIAVDTVSDN